MFLFYFFLFFFETRAHYLAEGWPKTHELTVFASQEMRLSASPIRPAWGDSFIDLKLETVIVVAAVVCFSLFPILPVLKALTKIATPLLFLKKTECEIFMAHLRGVLVFYFYIG